MPTKLTPLQRLSFAFERELDLANDEKLESKLAEQYLKRVTESEIKRNNVFKTVVVLDAILTVAVTGNSISIPHISISTSEFPAFKEIIVAVICLSVYIASHTFLNWMCYDNIDTIFTKRRAEKKKIDPDLIKFSELPSEPTLKMMRSKFNFYSLDWFSPHRPFLIVSRAYEILNSIFFLSIAAIHFSLIGIAIKQIFTANELNIAYLVFYFWIFISTFLTFFIWFVPGISFSFSIYGTPDK